MSLGKSSSPRAPTNIPRRFVAKRVEWGAFCFSLFRALHPCNFVLQNGEKTRRKKRDGSSERAGDDSGGAGESEMNSDASFSFLHVE